MLTFEKFSTDLDASSHSAEKGGGNPETIITLGLATAGKYVFRVQEYSGKNSDAMQTFMICRSG